MHLEENFYFPLMRLPCLNKNGSFWGYLRVGEGQKGALLKICSTYPQAMKLGKSYTLAKRSSKIYINQVRQP